LSSINCELRPGDLCKYMSRIVLILSDPYTHQPLGSRYAPTRPEQRWIEAIEIDDNTVRKIDCEQLVLIQRAEG